MGASSKATSIQNAKSLFTAQADLQSLDAARLAEVCRAWLQCNPDIVVLLGADQRIAHVSRGDAGDDASIRLAGADWRQVWVRTDRAKAEAAAQQAAAGQTARFQGAIDLTADDRRWWDVIVAPVANNGAPAGAAPDVLALLRDVTAFKQAEERQAQSRRLEAIGRLAGGIAHDFNNLLTVIMSATESVAAESAEPASREQAQVGLEAAERGADLVRRLLTFSNRSGPPAGVADAGDAVAALSRLLQRTLPSGVVLETRGPADLLFCKGDRSELEAALLNLCVNARDAMPDGGRLHLAVGGQTLERQAAAGLGLKPGRYAVFTVADTGVGMSEATLARAIEPFFTTKRAAGGAGLGLSGADGFARSQGGALVIRSRAGEGAHVSLYLPAVRRPAQGELELTAAAIGQAGCDVLLVEDDPDVRAQTTRMLAGLDCRVTPVADAGEALQRLESGHAVDLLITDLRLSGRAGGRALATAARAMRPRLKILFTSGDFEEFDAADGQRDVAFLPKPFGGPQLAAAMAAAMSRYDSGRAPPRRRKPRPTTRRAAAEGIRHG